MEDENGATIWTGIPWSNVSDITYTTANITTTTSVDLPFVGLQDWQLNAIAFTDLASSALSTIGAASIIGVAARRRQACNVEVFPILMLAIADLLAAATLMVAVSLHLAEKYNFSVNYNKCFYITGFTSCFFVITFLLTLCYALGVLQRVVRSRTHRLRLLEEEPSQRDRRVRTIVYLAAWLTPLAVTVGVLLVSRAPPIGPTVPASEIEPPQNQYCTSCVPLFHDLEDACTGAGRTWQQAFEYLFIIPLLATCLILMVLYYAIYSSFRQSQRMGGILAFQQRQAEVRVRNKAICYTTVFIVCWAPSLVLGILALSSRFSMQNFFWLYVIQAVMSPLQGFLNCVVYGWRREGFRRAVADPSTVNFAFTASQSSYGSVDM